MKILHINTERTWRGGEQQTLNLLAGLNDRRIASHLVCQAGSPMEERAVRAGVEVFPVTMRGEIDLVGSWKTATNLGSHDEFRWHALVWLVQHA